MDSLINTFHLYSTLFYIIVRTTVKSIISIQGQVSQGINPTKSSSSIIITKSLLIIKPG